MLARFSAFPSEANRSKNLLIYAKQADCLRNCPGTTWRMINLNVRPWFPPALHLNCQTKKKIERPWLELLPAAKKVLSAHPRVSCVLFSGLFVLAKRTATQLICLAQIKSQINIGKLTNFYPNQLWFQPCLLDFEPECYSSCRLNSYWLLQLQHSSCRGFGPMMMAQSTLTVGCRASCLYSLSLSMPQLHVLLPLPRGDVLRKFRCLIFPFCVPYILLSPGRLLWFLHWRCGPNWISLGKYMSMINHLTKPGRSGRTLSQDQGYPTRTSRSRLPTRRTALR